ncbi:related to ubiquitin conjugating enzyme (UbcJ) [Ramularia collo-cygni]|uniref:Related to ubiquitin conjugating enzyme (UbcJ) n=1 Tax=Ramularia collo-cygni TaxID=112498 RepID=A0A2D3URV8_9PEZI|nr:related to ubiquitin conjugating enzyme (UbcJ) [Ramularia collo-cygni]CZT18851.1 related to ubiquitin conjugating enzyme (UbcJ) [Ramularia collo-cygni]
MASKRLIKELDAYRRDPSPVVPRLEPQSDDNLFSLIADLKGPEGTAYEGGLWTLQITVPQTYPNNPPEITFRTPCCHPNINFKTGEICLDLLKSAWTPAYSIVKTLEAVQMLLGSEGNPDSPLNIDIAKLLRAGDVLGAEGLVRFYTRMLAMGR